MKQHCGESVSLRCKFKTITALIPRSVAVHSCTLFTRVCSAGATDLCLLPMDEGSCQKYTLRWYFNSQVRACRPFIYSGCKGNDNRFLHLEECEQACLRETEGT
uniref:BPTI/Kunitz inhibitor domain-containing protein n=1 Tax=Poecilia latipinna TaxID=48699 RepID=A0A3B3UDV9_9TELE